MDRIKLMNSLLLSMPGSLPFFIYGDEIGMGDNFFIGDRKRAWPATPMQWSPDPQRRVFACRPPSACTCRPSWMRCTDTSSTNVEAQSRDPQFTLELDQAHAGRAQDQPGVRARRAALS